MNKSVRIIYTKHLVLWLGCCLFFACSKEDKANYYQPTGPFEVSISSTDVIKGTPLILNFVGFADSVTLYTGKEGHVYAYRNRTEAEDVKTYLSFTSYRQWGTQENTLKLLVSNDFDDGNYNATGIAAATWIDITERAMLSNGQDNTPSGQIDITDLLDAKKPLFIAFKFIGAAGSTQRTWTIKNFLLKSVLPNDVTTDIANVSNAGWKAIDMKNPDKQWTQSSTQIQMVGGDASAGENEDWIISKAFSLNRVSPDQGEIIKSRYQLMPKSYRFVYDDPGVYTAVVVSNNSASQADEKVTEFSIVVK